MKREPEPHVSKQLTAHHALAKIVQMRRKSFVYELAGVAVAGGVFGYLLSPFTLTLLSGDAGVPVFSWTGVRELVIATFGVHGVMIWPVIFSLVFVIVRRRGDAKIAAKIAVADENARLARAEETQRKIKDARIKGFL